MAATALGGPFSISRAAAVRMGGNGRSSPDMEEDEEYAEFLRIIGVGGGEGGDGGSQREEGGGGGAATPDDNVGAGGFFKNMQREIQEDRRVAVSVDGCGVGVKVVRWSLDENEKKEEGPVEPKPAHLDPTCNLSDNEELRETFYEKGEASDRLAALPSARPGSGPGARRLGGLKGSGDGVLENGSQKVVTWCLDEKEDKRPVEPDPAGNPFAELLELRRQPPLAPTGGLLGVLALAAAASVRDDKEAPRPAPIEAAAPASNESVTADAFQRLSSSHYRVKDRLPTGDVHVFLPETAAWI